MVVRARLRVAADSKPCSWVGLVILLRLSPGDLERLRFAYSPLAEVAESLYVLHSGQIPALHRGWFDHIRTRLRRVDTRVLRAIVPAPRPHVASFLLSEAREPSTSIDVQLAAVAGYSTARLRADLEVVWRGEIPPETKRVLEHGGGPRIAEALHQYWLVAIKPFWPQIRAVLDADVAYRATRLARGGIEGLLADLHPELELAEHAIEVQSSAAGSEHELRGAGLLLVPCVFAWPHVMVDIDAGNPPSITYGPRGIGDLWPQAPLPDPGGDALAALLGRSRAAILRAIALPKSTSDLAVELSQSMPAVSAHLAVLRRSGLVSSWRAGRRVLYQLTPLARSVLAASGTRVTAEVKEATDDGESDRAGLHVTGRLHRRHERPSRPAV
jgi:DNA-binding transcriptional ArsR family regulator